MSFLFHSLCSEPAQTPFAPTWRYIMGDEWIKGVNFKNLSKFILSKEKEIINSYPAPGNNDGYTGLGLNSLTSRYSKYNLLGFNTPEIKQLHKEISRIHNEFIVALKVTNSERIWIQCWANVLRDGEEIKPHLHAVHPFTYLGGHITIQCNEGETVTSTVYINPINQINDPQLVYIKNEVGKITLFQNNIPHFTTPHKGNKERISIAFDLSYDNHPIDKSNMLLLDHETKYY